MSTLERLREAQHKRRRTINVGGVDVVLVPMTATTGLSLQKRFGEMFSGGEIKADNPVLMDFYIELIAKCAIEEDGTPALDSEDGRDLLRSLPMQDQMELGAAAAEVNGLARDVTKGDEAKKN